MNSFITYMKNQGLSEKTIAEHSRGFVKFHKIGGDLKWSENEIIDFIKENYNEGSERKIISSTISKYRHYKGNQMTLFVIFYAKPMPRRRCYNVKRMIS